MVNQKNR